MTLFLLKGHLGQIVLTVAALAICMAACPDPASASTTTRQRILLDANWRFSLYKAAPLMNSVGLSGWRWEPIQRGAGGFFGFRRPQPPFDTTAAPWSDTTIGSDAFAGKAGFAWFQATLPAYTLPDRLLYFQSVGDTATVYLNGVRIVSHTGASEPFDVGLDQYWKDGGPNVVTVMVQAAGGGILGPVSIGERASGAATNPVLPGFDDSTWKVVHLPHDYVVQGTFVQGADASHGSLPVSPAWYRKTFSVPRDIQGKSVWIDFDGVYRDSIVWLNGVKLGEHQGGYTSFRYDITRYLNSYGANELTVLVDPRNTEGWWYEGGGIYRHVWLNIAGSVHVAPWGTYVVSKVAGLDPTGKTAQVGAVSADLTISTDVEDDDTAAGPVEVVSDIVDQDGKNVASTRSSITDAIVPGESTVTQTVAVANANLWSVETPRLYTLHTTILKRGRPVDFTQTPFGIRTIYFDPNTGFYLNGKPVKLKGTCNHQDFAGVGIGMPDSVLSWRIKQLKGMGSNAVRMSHNPPASELLDACDRQGMLVMDENRHLGDTFSAKTRPGTPYTDLTELNSMIRRDRNHPSIIMWSMCNEEGLQGTDEGAQIFAAMKQDVLKYDTTRPITSAMNGGYGSAFSNEQDLQGINYHVDEYDSFHTQFPTKPIYGSETGSAVGARGIYAMDQFNNRYYGDQADGFVAAYDVNAPPWANTAEDAWKPIAARPFVAGGFVWTGFDYKGEPTPFGWPDVNSNFGILDECGFPKDSYYYYQSVWGDKPVVHLLPHWNWAGKEGQPIDVWCYSNAARVELFLNGKSLGANDMPANSHLEWSVDYAPGALMAKGYDAGGKTIGFDTVRTTGAPAALVLKTDRTKLIADGEDVTMVEVDVVDSSGLVVPTADNMVKFQVTGAARIAGVGNGDPTCHEPDQADYRSAFNGKCMVLVGADEQPGRAVLVAASPGLRPATISFRAR